MDRLSVESRSRLMGRIPSKDTVPEVTVRSLLHRLGFRFRIHRKDLPGCPDIVLPRHRKIILVHGCFWHGHGCKISPKPKSNQAYWEGKIAANKARDARTLRSLARLKWSVLELWECETRDPVMLERIVGAFMGTRRRNLGR
jgi:DNA mismatch endonuclease, patch repair protein